MIRQFGIQKPTGKNLLIHTHAHLQCFLGENQKQKHTHNWFSPFETSFEYNDMAMREYGAFNQKLVIGQ